MFAGGRLRQREPIPVGSRLDCHFSLASFEIKAGRTGEMAFVTTRHELSVDGVQVATEEQDIVYRSEPTGHRQISRPAPAVLRYGSPDQKRAYLPGIAKGSLRLQAFSVTEQTAGSDTTSIATTARRDGDSYVIFNYATNQVHYEGLRVPASSLIGANQGVQFPIAQAYMQLRAADLMRYQAADLFDADESCGAEANMAKLLASEASWAAANVCLDTQSPTTPGSSRRVCARPGCSASTPAPAGRSTTRTADRTAPTCAAYGAHPGEPGGGWRSMSVIRVRPVPGPDSGPASTRSTPSRT